MATTRIVLVPDGARVPGLLDIYGLPPEVVANPTMSVNGMVGISRLVTASRLKSLGPYDMLYTSRSARTADTVSVISLALDRDFRSLMQLTIPANKEGETITIHPGFQPTDNVGYQRSALEFVGLVFDLHRNKTILAVTHLPMIAGLIGHSKGIVDDTGLAALMRDPSLIRFGFGIVETSDGETVKVLSGPTD